MKSLTEIYGEPISVYTTQDALNDGVLVALDRALTAEAGVTIPVYLTAAAHADCVAWDENAGFAASEQSETGRAWDVAWMLRAAVAGCKANRKTLGLGDRFPVTFYRVPPRPRATTARKVVLDAIGGVDEAGAMFFTLMLPTED